METKEQHIAQLLQCPLTCSTLEAMDADALKSLNELIGKGEIVFLNGQAIEKEIHGAYVSHKLGFIYPVIHGIVCMLPKYALIHKEDIDIWSYLDDFKPENMELENFYEAYGWHKTESGHYKDAAMFEDLREVSKEYIQKCHQRIQRLLPNQGRYLLDAASGPIQFDEYLEYSEKFEYRVCLDISAKALSEARNKLGEKGIYILGDLANLPIKSNMIDASISLNTIYHLPKEHQMSAFKELHRVLKPQAPGIVVYEWARHAWAINALVWPYKVYQHIHKWMRHKKVIQSDRPEIHFYAFPQSQFTSSNMGFEMETKVWRSLSVPFLKIYIHSALFGKSILKFVYQMEERFPRLMGTFGEYPILYFNKQ